MMPPDGRRCGPIASTRTFYDKLQKDVAKAAGRTPSPDPDTVLAQVAQRAPRLDGDRDEVQGRGDPDLGLPGQPDVDGRRRTTAPSPSSC